MPAEAFVDTNVLVYAHDLDAGKKHECAKRLISDCPGHARAKIEPHRLIA
jgi:predicted nucleic acid-binding protein